MVNVIFTRLQMCLQVRREVLRSFIYCFSHLFLFWERLTNTFFLTGLQKKKSVLRVKSRRFISAVWTGFRKRKVEKSVKDKEVAGRLQAEMTHTLHIFRSLFFILVEQPHKINYPPQKPSRSSKIESPRA